MNTSQILFSVPIKTQSLYPLPIISLFSMFAVVQFLNNSCFLLQSIVSSVVVFQLHLGVVAQVLTQINGSSFFSLQCRRDHDRLTDEVSPFDVETRSFVSVQLSVVESLRTQRSLTRTSDKKILPPMTVLGTGSLCCADDSAHMGNVLVWV